jgi:hypothetical protein
MKKRLALSPAVLLCGAIAFAQDYPKMETFVGYTLTRANSATDIPSFHANGGGGQFDYNFDKWFGFVADIGAVHNGNIGGNHIDTTMINYLFGPRVSLRHSRLNPYFEITFGGIGAGTSVAVTGTIVTPPPSVTNPIYLPGQGTLNGNGPVSLRAVHHQTAFAMAVGGGLDIKMSKHVSLRPIGLDYFLTRLQNIRTLNDNNQHNIRYTAGLNFTFGAQ